MTKLLEIGICDTNRQYMASLVSYINDDESLGQRAVSFRESSEIDDYMENHKLDVIIAGSFFPYDEDGSGGIRYGNVPCLILTEGEESDKRYMTSRYQNARSICSRAAALVSGKKNDICKAVGTRHVTAVYSPFGRCGKTRMARELAAKAGTKGLYVGIEDLTSVLLTSDLLYLAKTGNERFGETALADIKSEDGVNVLRLSESYLDARLLTVKDMAYIADSLLGLGIHETLVFDIGSAVPADFEILTVFDEIIVPVPEGDLYRRKFESFTRILRGFGLDELTDRMNVVNVKR